MKCRISCYLNMSIHKYHSCFIFIKYIEILVSYSSHDYSKSGQSLKGQAKATAVARIPTVWKTDIFVQISNDFLQNAGYLSGL